MLQLINGILNLSSALKILNNCEDCYTYLLGNLPNPHHCNTGNKRKKKNIVILKYIINLKKPTYKTLFPII